MRHSPPVHAMNPHLYDLVHVRLVFDQPQTFPESKTVLSGELVETVDGEIRIFQYLGSDNVPVLLEPKGPLKFAVNRKSRRKLGNTVDALRTHHTSHPSKDTHPMSPDISTSEKYDTEQPSDDPRVYADDRERCEGKEFANWTSTLQAAATEKQLQIAASEWAGGLEVQASAVLAHMTGTNLSYLVEILRHAEAELKYREENPPDARLAVGWR